MIEFIAFTWLLSRDTARSRERGGDGEGFWLLLFLIPIALTVCFAYLLFIGLKDLGVGAVIRWTATVLTIGLALAACLDGRWLVAVAYAFSVGLVGLGMVTFASFKREKAAAEESGEESSIDGPRWRFS